MTRLTTQVIDLCAIMWVGVHTHIRTHTYPPPPKKHNNRGATRRVRVEATTRWVRLLPLSCPRRWRRTMAWPRSGARWRMPTGVYHYKICIILYYIMLCYIILYYFILYYIMFERLQVCIIKHVYVYIVYNVILYADLCWFGVFPSYSQTRPSHHINFAQ